MRIFRRITAGVAIAAIPFVVLYYLWPDRYWALAIGMAPSLLATAMGTVLSEIINE